MWGGGGGLGMVLHELREWEHAGLIPRFKDSDMQDVVLASVLKAVRKHMTKDEGDG